MHAGRRVVSGVTMGDVRFADAYRRLKDSVDRATLLRRMEDDDLVAALAASSRAADPFLANILATELLNRVRRLRASLEHMAEGVAALGTDGAVQWLNPAAERLLGWSREEAVGRDFHDLVRHRDGSGAALPPADHPFARVVARGEVVSGDGDVFSRRDGTDFCVTYTGAPVRDAEGDVHGVVIAFSDCSARKGHEAALRESEQRYRSLFENSLDGVVSVSTEGLIVDANAAAQALTGIPIEATRGRPFSEYLHPDDVEVALRLFAQVVQGEPQRITLRLLRQDGTFVPAQTLGVPILVDGKVVGVHGVVRPA